MEEEEERREELAERAFADYVRGDFSSAITSLEELLGGRASRTADNADGGSGDGLSDVLKLRVEHNLSLLQLLQPGAAEGDGINGAAGSSSVTAQRSDALRRLQALLERYKPAVGDKVFPVLARAGPAGLDDARPEDVLFDADGSRVLYNYALLLFSMKQHRSAQFVLESVWTHIGLCGEATGIAVVCLLLDVLIHTARGAMTSARSRSVFGSKVAPLLQFLSKAVSDEAPVNGGGVSPSASPEGDEGPTRRASVQAELAFRMHLYKAKCALLQQNHRTSRKELKSALELYQRELREGHGASLARGAADGDRSELLAVLLPLPRAEHANATALFLKANAEFLRSNIRKALKLLDAANTGANEEQNTSTGGGRETGSSILSPSMRVMFLNNMGCLHLRMHRQRAALHYFQQALADLEMANPDLRSADTDSGPNADLEVLPTEEVLYNTGLQLLLAGKPREAFVALRASATLFTHRPRLWIRLAECCIGVDAGRAVEAKQQRQADPTRAVIAYGDLVRQIVGQGSSRRVLLPVPEPPPDASGLPEAEGTGLGATLQDAVTYLGNALYLVEDLDVPVGNDKVPGGNDNSEALAVFVAAQTHLAYVYLRLAAPSLALDAARKVLAAPLPENSDQASLADEDGETPPASNAQKGALARRYLAHSYAAEALCALGRPEEALPHLQGREQGGEKETSAASEGLVKAAAQVSASAGLGVTGPWGLLSPESVRGGWVVEPEAGADGAPDASLGVLGAVGLPSAADANAAAPSLASPEKRVQSDAQVNLATVALLQGDLPRAQHHMELALQQDAYSPRARRTLVFLLLRYGHTERALRVLKGAVP